jgi:hypothetical protein
MMQRNPTLNRTSLPPKVVDTLLSQVTALMMNAQRYEVRYSTYLSLMMDAQAEEARVASDHFAEMAFSVINQAMTGVTTATTDQGPLTRDEVLRREVPDAVVFRETNPEMPDADDMDDGVVVGVDGAPLSKSGEQDI